MSKRVVLSTDAQADLAGLDRSVALRVVAATDRFAATGAGNVQCLRSIHPREFRLRVGDWRVRFHDHGEWIDILRVRNRREAYRRRSDKFVQPSVHKLRCPLPDSRFSPTVQFEA